jgi:hypothetical protein
VADRVAFFPEPPTEGAACALRGLAGPVGVAHLVLECIGVHSDTVCSSQRTVSRCKREVGFPTDAHFRASCYQLKWPRQTRESLSDLLWVISRPVEYLQRAQ